MIVQHPNNQVIYPINQVIYPINQAILIDFSLPSTNYDHPLSIMNSLQPIMLAPLQPVIIDHLDPKNYDCPARSLSHH